MPRDTTIDVKGTPEHINYLSVIGNISIL